MSATLVHWCLGFGGWIGVIIGTGCLILLPSNMGYMRYVISASMPLAVAISTLLVATGFIGFYNASVLTVNSMMTPDTMMSVVACICCLIAITILKYSALVIVLRNKFYTGVTISETVVEPNEEGSESDEEDGGDEEGDEEDGDEEDGDEGSDGDDEGSSEGSEGGDEGSEGDDESDVKGSEGDDESDAKGSEGDDEKSEVSDKSESGDEKVVSHNTNTLEMDKVD